jgi:hypothetical protein
MGIPGEPIDGIRPLIVKNKYFIANGDLSIRVPWAPT